MLKLAFVIVLFFGFTDDPMESSPGKNSADFVKLEGIIVDEETNEPLTGAKIEILGLNTEIYSDFDGKFIVSTLKPGIYTLNASLISYQSKKIEEIQLDLSDQSIIIALKP